MSDSINLSGQSGDLRPFTRDFAPWMGHAHAELEKKVAEVDLDKEADAYYKALLKRGYEYEKMMSAEDFSFPSRYSTRGPVRYGLMNIDLAEALALEEKNPEITKYFRPLGVPAVRHNAKKNHAEFEVTAWCAAFVHYCLRRAGLDPKTLQTARAADWLKFGIPLSEPMWGCIVVLQPNAATRRTGAASGHVGFYVETAKENDRIPKHIRKPGKLMILSGNNTQDMVGIDPYDVTNVMPGGYRWPGQRIPDRVVPPASGGGGIPPNAV
jgi:uncharacterized protein (TIGR02594 family)